MNQTYLDHNWQVKKNPNYWELVSYILFVAFIISALWASMITKDYEDQQRANKWLRNENINLKHQIDSINTNQYDYEKEVITKAKK